jgi:type II secretory ATPase GspE/PulE/Tfp pilus assembly ATPase PilB-like protein
VFEVLNVTDTVREAITTRQPEPALAAVASLAGYSPMLDDADSKVALGVTTPEEVLRSGITDREPEGYRRQASSPEHASTQEA